MGGYKENNSIARRGQLLTLQQLPDPQHVYPKHINTATHIGRE